MKAGTIYTIINGKYSDKYLCVNGTSKSGETISLQFKRVRLPKNKIDGVRLPVSIIITEYGQAATNHEPSDLKAKPTKKLQSLKK